MKAGNIKRMRKQIKREKDVKKKSYMKVEKTETLK